MFSFSPRSSSGANSRPVGDGPWALRLGLGITAFVLTVVLLVVVVLALARAKPDDGNGRHRTASLAVSPSSLSFRNVEVGAETSSQQVTLVSTGKGAVELDKITIDGPDRDGFDADRKCSGMTLRSERSCTVSVTFNPVANRKYSAQLVIDRAAGSSKTVQLSGTGATAHARLNPLVMRVSASVGESVTRHFIVENTGKASLTIYDVSLDDRYDFFTSKNDACSNISLEPEDRCSIALTFTPTSNCDSEGELVIKHDAPGSRSRARLYGATKSLPCTGNATVLPSSTASPYSPSTASPVP